MINWLKKWLGSNSECAAIHTSGRLSRAYELATTPSNVSEPVLSIVKTFKEKGRWKITPCFDIFKISLLRELPRFTVKDTFTGEVFDLYSHTYFYHFTTRFQFVVPDRVHTYSTPTWMTAVEGEYMKNVIQGYMEDVNERFKVLKDRSESKDQKQSKANQDKERNRLMNLYCGEHKCNS